MKAEEKAGPHNLPSVDVVLALLLMVMTIVAAILLRLEFHHLEETRMTIEGTKGKVVGVRGREERKEEA